MRSDKFLWDNVCMPIYRMLYRESSPQADFDKLIESGETNKTDWFMKYTLDSDRISEIIDLWCTKFKCSKRERRKISVEIYLGMCPKNMREKDV